MQHIARLLLVALPLLTTSCALIDGLTGDSADPADASPSADMPSDADMPILTDMPGDADMRPDSSPDDMDMVSDQDIAEDMSEDMSEDLSEDMLDMPDAMDMSPTPAEPPLHTLAVSDLSTCALKDKAVYCWGDNNNQLLGINSTTRHIITPTRVMLGADAVAITAGSAHFCALLAGGGLKCWGDGGQGRLGDNNTLSRTVPVQVMGLTQGVQAVDAGASFTCALLASGALQCWGANFAGQLGNAGSGQGANKLVPTETFDLDSGVSTFSAGAGHACAVHEGALKCWGDNEYGQLGHGTMDINATVPRGVVGMEQGVTAVSAGGRHTCAIKDDALYCWGYNVYGQLGMMGGSQRAPAPVPGMEQGVTAVSAGTHYTCAVKDDALYCWGDDDARQLGTGNATAATRPAFVPIAVADHGSDVREIVAGNTHTCARKGEQVSCWGYNFRAQLAQPTLEDRIAPTPVLSASAAPNSFSALHTNNEHTCGITNGGAFCWGFGFWGQLGDGKRGDYLRARPAPVMGLDAQVSAVSAGEEHSCGIKNNILYCWGRNSSGQLGDGTGNDSLTPVEPRNFRSLGAATHVATGSAHTCAIADGKLYCWGSGSSGQLGGAMSPTRLEPGLVPMMDADVTAVVAADDHTCAVKAGGLYCWGRNLAGQLGTGNMSDVTTPRLVMGLEAQVSAVVTSPIHTCAIQANAIKCWGSNSRGQLGDGTTTNRLMPGAAVSLPSQPIAVAVGLQHTCAALAGGMGMRCWGSNADGQLGNNDMNISPINRLTPDPVAGPLTDIISVTAAAAHTCAVRATGEALCWGANNRGQLGSGQGTSLGPIPIMLP